MADHPFLLSYPGPSWAIRGGANFRSVQRAETNPRQALSEWLALADAITTAGREIAVLPPPEVDPPLTGLIYAANHGALFVGGDRPMFLIARMFVEHRRPEAEPLAEAIRTGLQIDVDRARCIWEGQADIATLSGDRALLSWGVRTERDACDEIRGWLGEDTRTLDIKLTDPYFHGDTCLSVLPRPGGEPVLMVYPGALVDRTPEDLAAFADMELLEIDEADARAYACNALPMDGTILMPAGVRDRLNRRLEALGFEIQVMEFDELFGKGGGGPRCLINELRGLAPAEVPEAVRYSTQRDRLYALKDTYPERPR